MLSAARLKRRKYFRACKSRLKNTPNGPRPIWPRNSISTARLEARLHQLRIIPMLMLLNSRKTQRDTRPKNSSGFCEMDIKYLANSTNDRHAVTLLTRSFIRIGSACARALSYTVTNCLRLFKNFPYTVVQLPTTDCLLLTGKRNLLNCLGPTSSLAIFAPVRRHVLHSRIPPRALSILRSIESNQTI